MIIETDILIVGGGPAGATLAKYLSNSNVKNILIQRNLNFKKPCGGGIRLDAFTDFALDTSLIKKYVDTILLVYKAKTVHVDISQTPIAVVERKEFDGYLRAEAQKSGTTLYEAAFVSLEIFDGYVISTIKKEDEYLQIKSNYLIAADGVNSKIRKIINGESVPSNLTQYTNITSEHYEVCEFHFGKKVAGEYYAWAFPHADGTNIGTLAEYDRSYINNLRDSLAIEEQSKVLSYKIPHFKNPLFYKQRVFFVGDSASQVLPFTYEGIYYAMHSAKILSEVLIAKQEPSEYEKLWNQKYYKKFTTLLKLQNIFLMNNFMIFIMMRLFQNRHVQKQILNLWLGKKEVEINFSFFIKALKRFIFSQ
jgi:geranylgeranyl reductase